MVPFAGPVVFVFGFIVAWWLLRKVSHRTVLHGALIGILATVIYLLMCLPSPGGLPAVIAMYGPTFFVVGNGLRIVGCIAGAYALRYRKPSQERSLKDA